LQPFVQLVVRHRQRRQEANDVSKRAGRNEDDAPRPRQPDDLVALVLRGLTRRTVGHELDADHRTSSPYLADERRSAFPFTGARLDSRADGIAPGHELTALEEVEHSVSCRARNWISTVSATKTTLSWCIHQLGPPDDRGERHSRSKRLGGHEQIWLQAFVLAG